MSFEENDVWRLKPRNFQTAKYTRAVRRAYYYTLDPGTANFCTICFTEGRRVAEFLKFRNLDSTDMADLEQLEVDLRHTHRKMGALANEFHALAKRTGEYVPSERFDATPFDDHYAVRGGEALRMERELSIHFITIIALAAGVEDRMARITIRLNERSPQLWPGIPQRGRRRTHIHAGQVRTWLRDQSGLVKSRLEEIIDHRNSAIHERYYYAHVIEEDGSGDILFTPAMNAQELTTSLPTYRVTTLGNDVSWLIGSYLDWWCKESVRQIDGL